MHPLLQEKGMLCCTFLMKGAALNQSQRTSPLKQETPKPSLNF